MKRSTAMLMTLFLIFASAILRADEMDFFSEGEHCVAYSTSKTILYVTDLTVVGKNCAIDVSAKRTGSMVVVTLKAPLKNFDSGISARDRDVVEILKGNIRDHLLFVSEPFSDAAIKATRAGDTIKIKGKLTIGNDEFPIETIVTVVGEGPNLSVTGGIQTTYSAFGMKPPSIAGGVVADVHENLALHYRIVLKKVHGL